MEKIRVYGADWCGMTKRARQVLDDLHVDYEYVNIEEDEAGAKWVREQNADGKERKPTIKIGSQILIEPSDAELTAAVRINDDSGKTIETKEG